MSIDLNHLAEAEPDAPAKPAPVAEPAATPGAAAPAAVVAQPKAEPAPLVEPKVHGESSYDRITSMLMSMVISAGLIVSFLMLIYVTNKAYAGRVVAPLDLVEVYGDGTGTGGDPAGDANAQGGLDAGADQSDSASNNMAEDTSMYEEPSAQSTSNVVLDSMAEQVDTDNGEGVEVGSITSGSAVSSGQKSSRIGTAGIGIGTGGKGGNGVSREKRWVIVYPEGQPSEEYAKQLDTFGIELATFGTNKSIVIGSKFASSEPIKRSEMVTTFNVKKPLYFMLYAGSTRKAADVDLLKKAKIEAGNKPILQIYPKAVEEKLAALEHAKNQWVPAQIQKTYFSVYRSGSGWDFRVDSQEPRNVPAPAK